LKGVTVRVKGTRGIFSDLKTEFTDGSPAMHTLAPACKLRDEVRKRQIVPGELIAYVDFRGGQVLPEMYLPKKLSFTGTPLAEPRCTVCRARYQSQVRGDHATLIYKKKLKNPDGSPVLRQDGKEAEEVHEIAIAGGDPATEITVSNKPSHTVPHHFEKQFNIYVGQCEASQIRPVVTSEKCTTGKTCPQKSPPGVADPGDDCSVVRHP
jgi:hypothetical protein